MKRQAAAVLGAFLLAAAGAFPVMAGEWELSENGKYWTYCESPGDPVEDEWIEDNGKIYYVDAKGRMKTGWVKNADSGDKYFLGEDGAMCFNTFTKDDKYVGPDGRQVERYDTYRKAVKSELKKATKKKNTRRNSKKAAEASEADNRQFYFMLADLNLDDYADLVVMEGTETDKGPVEIAIWDPAEEKFQLSAEFDAPSGDGVRSTLYQDPQGETVWLEIEEKNGDFYLFQMKDQSMEFENLWSFVIEMDDWDGPVYLVNGQPEDREDWELLQAEARQARGGKVLDGYQPASEENIKTLVDRVLTEEELDLW